MRREPFNFTPTEVNSISLGSPHVRPWGVHRTCGEPDEIKKIPTRKIPTRKILPLLSVNRPSNFGVVYSGTGTLVQGRVVMDAYAEPLRGEAREAAASASASASVAAGGGQHGGAGNGYRTQPHASGAATTAATTTANAAAGAPGGGGGVGVGHDYQLHHVSASPAAEGTCCEPFKLSPMVVDSISPAHLHVLRAHIGVLRTCRWADEIKQNTHTEDNTAFRGGVQAVPGRCRVRVRAGWARPSSKPWWRRRRRAAATLHRAPALHSHIH